MTKNPYAISLVIPTYRRCASVKRLLEALTYQTLAASQFEVIVVIDGSEDGTRELVENFSVPYRLQTLWQANQGRAAACNAGIKAAQGDLIVLLDDDMEPTPDFLEAHQQAHSPASRLGIMGAVPINIDNRATPVLQYVGDKFNRHLEKLAAPDYQIQLRDFYSGNFSIQRKILIEVGAFDEAFKIYGNEDLELSLRLKEAQVTLRYCPEALARQYYNKDFRGLARDQIAKGKTAILLANKHHSAFYDLKLNQYRAGSYKWRLLRGSLLRLSRFWAGTPDLIIWLMQRLERYRPSRLMLYYTLALDYFYWVGAKQAIREQSATNGLSRVKPLRRSIG